MDDLQNDELGLHNPESNITCFVLYLSSLEFGLPPLYAELNRVMRVMDTTLLETLGPIMRALNEITKVGIGKKVSPMNGMQIQEKQGGIVNNIGGI